MQTSKQEVVHQTRVAETHLMLGGMHVYIHIDRVELEIQHESRMTAVIQNVSIGLTNGMGHQFVANNPAVDKKVLQVWLAAGKRGRSHPSPQFKTRGFGIHMHSVAHEVLT